MHATRTYRMYAPSNDPHAIGSTIAHANKLKMPNACDLCMTAFACLAQVVAWASRKLCPGKLCPPNCVPLQNRILTVVNRKIPKDIIKINHSRRLDLKPVW
jgi:hypothetical protein